MPTLTDSTKRAIKNYGADLCREAFRRHKNGNGASTIGIELGLTTRQADAAINAGRNLAEFEAEQFASLWAIAAVCEKQAAENEGKPVTLH